jgi:signal peptidase I
VDDKTDKKWSENLEKIEDPLNEKFSFFEFIWDLLKTAIIVVVVAFAVKFFLLQPYIVDGNSMLPNFENEECLLVEKVSYRFKSPKRGDVIVFHPPGQNSINYIKRIVGLPNERIEILENKIKIYNDKYPDGIFLDESYIPSSYLTVSEKSDGLYTVGNNEYFVLGDNREHSSDSREWGNLPETNILGKAWLEIFPFKNFDLVEHQNFAD